MKRNISYKKSILFSIGFLHFTGIINAQDLPRIQQLLAGKELARAKEAVDSAAVIYPTAAVWLLKAAVYDSISKDPVAKNLTADARWEAFQALQKAVLIDAGYVKSQLSAQKYKFADGIYDGFMLEGMNYYNAGAERDDKENFAKALVLFKKAAAVSQFIYTSQWGKTEVDTLSLLFLSKSAINAEKEEDALFYCKKIADNKYIHPGFKTSYEIVYQWLVYYFKSKKEAEAFTKYLTIGRQEYPLSAYFNLAEIDWLRQQQQYEQLFKKYRELIKTEPANAGYKLAFYRDQFNYIWQPEGSSRPNTLVSVTGLISALQQLVTANKQNLVAMNARLLLAKVYINQAQDAEQKMQAGYKKKRNDLLLLSNKYLKQIVAVKTPQNQIISVEAERLLVANQRLLKPVQRGYKSAFFDFIYLT